MNLTPSRETIPQPAVDKLLQTGWSIAQVVGSYCVAWRGNEELTLSWEADTWRIVAAKNRTDAA